MTIRYFSVCSGIEAATVAWHPLGWEPVAFAENASFPSAVLAHHYPLVPNIGDMRNALKLDCHIPRYDLLVGGTPCQSFSFAGDRRGLDDQRGNLALVFCQIAEKHRPTWVVWENVPGALSAQKGEAFTSITSALAELGYDLAYRVIDAQYCRVDGYERAVPQRRQRVFLVGCLGGGTRAAAVLFDREGLFGGPPPSRSTQSDATVPASVGSGVRGDAVFSLGFGGNDTRGPIDVATARNAHGGPHGRLDFESETFVVAFHARQDPDHGDVTHPLDTDAFSIGILNGRRPRRLTITESERLQGFPSVVEFIEDDMTRDELIVSALAMGHLIVDTTSGDVFRTRGIGGVKLPAPEVLSSVHPTGYRIANVRVGGCKKQVRLHRVVWIAANGIPPDGLIVAHKNNDKADNRLVNLHLRTSAENSTDASKDGLYAGDEHPLTKLDVDLREKLFVEYSAGGMSYSVLAEKYGITKGRVGQIVREYGYTNVPLLRKSGKVVYPTDGPRYKAVGNSMAVNCMRWIGKRIAFVNSLPWTDTQIDLSQQDCQN